MSFDQAPAVYSSYLTTSTSTVCRFSFPGDEIIALSLLSQKPRDSKRRMSVEVVCSGGIWGLINFGQYKV